MSTKLESAYSQPHSPHRAAHPLTATVRSALEIAHVWIFAQLAGAHDQGGRVRGALLHGRRGRAID